jgi:outer membrane protein
MSSGSVAARDLSLDQALHLAEQNSGQLKAYQAAYDAADATVGSARSERFPTLSLDSRAVYISDIASLNINIPGIFEMSREIGSKEIYQADLRLALPLYTGGRISSAIASAESVREYAQASARATLSAIQLQARLDYFGLRRAIQTKRAAEASMDRTTIISNDIQSSFSAGAADSVDILEARLALSRAEFQLRQAEVLVRTQTVQLATRLGLSITEPVEAVDTLPDPGNIPLTTPVISRPELVAAGASVSLARAGLKSKNSGWLPTLSAFTGYSYGKPNNDQFSGDWNDYYTFGAQLQWSLNLGLGNARRIASARAELEAARFRLQDLSEAINREAEIAAENLRLAFIRYLSARDQLEITRDNYRLARSQHENGILSANRLLEIEASLTEIEALALAAKVDFYIVQSGYYYATGDENLGKGL